MIQIPKIQSYKLYKRTSWLGEGGAERGKQARFCMWWLRKLLHSWKCQIRLVSGSLFVRTNRILWGYNQASFEEDWDFNVQVLFTFITHHEKAKVSTISWCGRIDGAKQVNHISKMLFLFLLCLSLNTLAHTGSRTSIWKFWLWGKLKCATMIQVCIAAAASHYSHQSTAAFYTTKTQKRDCWSLQSNTLRVLAFKININS